MDIRNHKEIENISQNFLHTHLNSRMCTQDSHCTYLRACVLYISILIFLDQLRFQMMFIANVLNVWIRRSFIYMYHYMIRQRNLFSLSVIKLFSYTSSPPWLRHWYLLKNLNIRHFNTLLQTFQVKNT